MTIEQEVRDIETSMLKSGRTHDEVAAAINKRFGGKITGKDIRNGDVWWRVGEASDKSFNRSLDTGYGDRSFDVPEDYSPWR